MSFPDDLYLKYIDGRSWLVTRRFRFFSKRAKVAFVVPAGFETDFASIPRVFWRVLPPTGKYGKAAVVHDFLYRRRLVPRGLADQVFLEAMTELGVPKATRRIMYYAVRVFGCFAYDGSVM